MRISIRMKEAFRNTVHQREEQKETEYMTKCNTSDYILNTSKRRHLSVCTSVLNVFLFFYLTDELYTLSKGFREELRTELLLINAL